MIKFEISSKTLEIWKTYIHHHELDRFPIHREFSDEIGSDKNECDLIFSI